MNMSVCVSRNIIVRWRDSRPVLVNERRGVALRLCAASLGAVNTFIEKKVASASLKCLRDSGYSIVDRRRFVVALFDAGIFYASEASNASAEEAFEAAWPFGKSTASHQFAVDQTQFADRCKEARKFRAALDRQSFPVVKADLEAHRIHQLNLPSQLRCLFGMFSRRRSARRHNAKAISREALEVSIYAGLGITSYLQLPGRPAFPLRFTPSQGGLASIGAYVFAARVDGLTRACYRYDAPSGELIEIASYPADCIGSIFGGQEWAGSAAAIIVLAADTRTIAWKYRDPGAYNAALIEAGHVGQNITVTAAQFGLSTVFTNAITQSAVCSYLRVAWPEVMPVYAIAIGDSNDIADPADDFGEDAFSLLAPKNDSSSSLKLTL